MADFAFYQHGVLTSQTRSKRCFSCVMAAGGWVWLHAHGAAALVVTIPKQPVLAGFSGAEPEGYRLTSVDIDGDARSDAWFHGDSSGLALVLAGSNRVFTKLSPPPNIGGLVANLASGISVSLSSNEPANGGWLTGESGRYSQLEVLGLPLNSTIATMGFSNSTGNTRDWLRTSGYIGFEVRSSSAVNYGWIHLNNEAGVVGYGGYIDAWGYETEPGKAIVTGVVPEPCSALNFAFGAMLLAAHRKRYDNTSRGTRR